MTAPHVELREAAKRIRNQLTEEPELYEAVAQVLDAHTPGWQQMHEQNTASGIRTRVIPNADYNSVLALARAINDRSTQ